MLGITMSPDPSTTRTPTTTVFNPFATGKAVLSPYPTPTVETRPVITQPRPVPIVCADGYHFEPNYGCVPNGTGLQPPPSTTPDPSPPATASNDTTAPPNQPSGGGTTATMTTPGGGAGSMERPIQRLPPIISPPAGSGTEPVVVQPTPATPWWKWALAAGAVVAVGGGIYYGIHR